MGKGKGGMAYFPDPPVAPDPALACRPAPWHFYPMKSPNSYAAAPLDRAAQRRRDAGWLAERLALNTTRLVPCWNGKHLVTGERDSPQPVYLDPTWDWWRVHAPHDPIFLGLEGDVAYFAADLSAVEDPKAHPVLASLGAFVDLRTLGPVLAPETGSLFAYARGLIHWHARHRFCGVCGAGTDVREAGHSRRCTNPACAAPHFPRTDPAIIVLVHEGDRCLLGRSARFPTGVFSTLAGFVEPGESLEDAVAREVFEEAGVRVADIRYHSSQPWPFPSSLMLGFHARAVGTALTIDRNELEDARWFDRDWLRRHEPSDMFRLPPRDSIARRLIQEWLDGFPPSPA